MAIYAVAEFYLNNFTLKRNKWTLGIKFNKVWLPFLQIPDNIF